MSTLSLKTTQAITALESVERGDLIALWVKAYGTPPFKGARRTTLLRGLSYHLHCKELSDLKPSVSRKLLKLAKTDTLGCAETGVMEGATASVSKTKAKRKPKYKPKTKLGTQLVREWNGRTHTVHVTDKGFVMSGVTYGSLSAAAKAITGAHWSGPRFFGVVS